jgi:nitrite reductase (NADH) small subunit
MSNWTEVVALEDIPQLGSRVITTDTMKIAVFRTATDDVQPLMKCSP